MRLVCVALLLTQCVATDANSDRDQLAVAVAGGSCQQPQLQRQDLVLASDPTWSTKAASLLCLCACGDGVSSSNVTRLIEVQLAKGRSSGEALLLTAGLMQLCRLRDGRDIFRAVASGQHSVAYFAAMAALSPRDDTIRVRLLENCSAVAAALERQAPPAHDATSSLRTAALALSLLAHSRWPGTSSTLHIANAVCDALSSAVHLPQQSAFAHTWLDTVGAQDMLDPARLSVALARSARACTRCRNPTTGASCPERCAHAYLHPLDFHQLALRCARVAAHAGDRGSAFMWTSKARALLVRAKASWPGQALALSDMRSICHVWADALHADAELRAKCQGPHGTTRPPRHWWAAARRALVAGPDAAPPDSAASAPATPSTRHTTAESCHCASPPTSAPDAELLAQGPVVVVENTSSAQGVTQHHHFCLWAISSAGSASASQEISQPPCVVLVDTEGDDDVDGGGSDTASFDSSTSHAVPSLAPLAVLLAAAPSQTSTRIFWLALRPTCTFANASTNDAAAAEPRAPMQSTALESTVAQLRPIAAVAAIDVDSRSRARAIVQMITHAGETISAPPPLVVSVGWAHMPGGRVRTLASDTMLSALASALGTAAPTAHPGTVSEDAVAPKSGREAQRAIAHVQVVGRAALAPNLRATSAGGSRRSLLSLHELRDVRTGLNGRFVLLSGLGLPLPHISAWVKELHVPASHVTCAEDHMARELWRAIRGEAVPFEKHTRSAAVLPEWLHDELATSALVSAMLHACSMRHARVLLLLRDAVTPPTTNLTLGELCGEAAMPAGHTRAGSVRRVAHPWWCARVQRVLAAVPPRVRRRVLPLPTSALALYAHRAVTSCGGAVPSPSPRWSSALLLELALSSGVLALTVEPPGMQDPLPVLLAAQRGVPVVLDAAGAHSSGMPAAILLAAGSDAAAQVTAGLYRVPRDGANAARGSPADRQANRGGGGGGRGGWLVPHPSPSLFERASLLLCNDTAARTAGDALRIGWGGAAQAGAVAVLSHEWRTLMRALVAQWSEAAAATAGRVPPRTGADDRQPPAVVSVKDRPPLSASESGSSPKPAPVREQVRADRRASPGASTKTPEQESAVPPASHKPARFSEARRCALPASLLPPPARLLVVAHCTESIDWLYEGSVSTVPHFIYHKCGDASGHADDPHSMYLPNLGNECLAYLTFITDNYDCLPELTLFVQAQPLDHSPHAHVVLPALTVDSRRGFQPLSVLYKAFDSSGAPYNEQMAEAYADAWHAIFDSPPPQVVGCFGNAMFAVLASRLHARPPQFYDVLRAYVNGSWPIYRPRAEWTQRAWRSHQLGVSFSAKDLPCAVLEHMWHCILDTDGSACPIYPLPEGAGKCGKTSPRAPRSNPATATHLARWLQGTPWGVSTSTLAAPLPPPPHWTSRLPPVTTHDVLLTVRARPSRRVGGDTATPDARAAPNDSEGGGRASEAADAEQLSVPLQDGRPRATDPPAPMHAPHPTLARSVVIYEAVPGHPELVTYCAEGAGDQHADSSAVVVATPEACSRVHAARWESALDERFAGLCTVRASTALAHALPANVSRHLKERSRFVSPVQPPEQFAPR